MPERGGQPRPIKSVIEAMLRSWGLDRAAKEQRVFVAWPDAVGESVARNARPMAVHHGLLIVLVRDNVWMQELAMMRDEIKKKLNRALGPGLIQELRFKLGDWEEEESPAAAAEAPLSPEAEAEARQTAAVISDPRLREQVLKTLFAAARKEKTEAPAGGKGEAEDPDEES
jgi:hypothetical protein